MCPCSAHTLIGTHTHTSSSMLQYYVLPSNNHCHALTLLLRCTRRHYQPWWLQPPMVVGTGVAFVLAALVLDNEELGKTALLAAGPVALYWGIFLLVLPRRFKSFAVEYIETHPESEAAALEHQQQQIQEMQEQLLHTLEQQQQQEQEGHQEQH